MKSYHGNQILLEERLCLSQVINVVSGWKQEDSHTVLSINMEGREVWGWAEGQQGRVVMVTAPSASEGQSLRVSGFTAPSLPLIQSLCDLSLNTCSLGCPQLLFPVPDPLLSRTKGSQNVPRPLATVMTCGTGACTSLLWSLWEKYLSKDAEITS